MGLAIHFHESADVASHANVLWRGIEMGRKITGVRRVAKDAVALFVRAMRERVSGQGVAGQAQLSGRRRKSYVGRAFHVGDRVAARAAHRDSCVDILPRGFVIVALKTFGRINVGRESYWMLPKVGPRRGSERQ